MIKLLVSAWLSVLLSCIAASAQAQSAKEEALRLDAAREMVAVMRMDERARSWIERELPATDSRHALMAHMRTNVTSEQIREWYAEFYAYYTKAAVAQRISAAYRTTAGQHALRHALQPGALTDAQQLEVAIFNDSEPALAYQRLVERVGPKEAAMVPMWIDGYALGLLEEGLLMAERSRTLGASSPAAPEAEMATWIGVPSVDVLVNLFQSWRGREREAAKQYKVALDAFQAEGILLPPRLVLHEHIKQGRATLGRMAVHLDRFERELAAADAEAAAALDGKRTGSWASFLSGIDEGRARNRAVFGELFASHRAMFKAYHRILDFAERHQAQLDVVGDSLSVVGDANLRQYNKLQGELVRAVERCRRKRPAA